MNNSSIKQFIEAGNLTIGIEFGSTRIKTVAIDDNCKTLATGTFDGKIHIKTDIGHIL